MTALLMGYARSQRSGAGSNRERAPPIAAALADDQPDLATSEWQASVPQGNPLLAGRWRHPPPAARLPPWHVPFLTPTPRRPGPREAGRLRQSRPKQIRQTQSQIISSQPTSPRSRVHPGYRGPSSFRLYGVHGGVSPVICNGGGAALCWSMSGTISTGHAAANTTDRAVLPSTRFAIQDR